MLEINHERNMNNIGGRFPLGSAFSWDKLEFYGFERLKLPVKLNWNLKKHRSECISDVTAEHHYSQSAKGF